MVRAHSTAGETNREKLDRLYRDGTISETTYKGLIITLQSWNQEDQKGETDRDKAASIEQEL